MKLPDDAIGISDILAYRDCPERMQFGMARHTEEGENPEASGPNSAYGSAIHEAIHRAEQDGLTDEEAIQEGFKAFGRWLEPDDLERMRHDMETYRDRDFVGVRTVANEDDFKVPLLVHGGKQIYFRFKLDRLYQRIDNPGVFLHVDYKSSKWRKSAQEVQDDLQMWAYNWGIHEVFPECQSLTQHYDQLRYGVEPTSKSDDQRTAIRDWLRKQVVVILEDDELEPTLNQWCPYCALVSSCPVPKKTTQFAAARIAALAPRDETTGKLALDLDLMQTYIDQLEEVGPAVKAVAEFDKAVKAALREMGMEARTVFGYEMSEPQSDTWTPEAIRAVHEIIGDEAFYELVGLTKTKVNSLVKDPGQKEDVFALATKVTQSPRLAPIKD